MKQYTIHDAAEVLGTDIETLDHWLHDAQLTLVHDTQDRSAPVLSQEQIEILAQRHNIQLVPPTDEPLRRLPPQQFESEGICVDALDLKRFGHQHTILLHDISLHIPHNAFIALVGGSGVGKTTLMYALSGLQPAPQGTVLYDGHNYYRHLSVFSTQIGYVPQDDIIHRRLTVKRALYYAARMRLPANLSRRQIKQRVDKVLTDVGIYHRRNLLVGRLSGGERKRVSIALELLANPSIFFLDEPTSGLDPGLDYRMMHLLRGLADKGHTIVLVTHTIMNIDVCDYVCFLARGGRLAYYGPPEEAKTYFGTSNFAQIYAALEPTEENPKIPEEAEERFRQSPYYQRYVLAPLNQVDKELERSAPPLPVTPIRHIGGWRQFGLLSLRYLELLKNDIGNLLILFLQAPIIGLILWYLAGHGTFDPTSIATCPTRADFLARSGPIVSINCQRVEHLLNSPEGAQIAQQRGVSKEQVLQNAIAPNSGADAQTLLFVIGFAAILFGCINGVREIVKELPIYRRERLVNMGIAPYLFSKSVVLGIFSLLQSALLIYLVNLKAPFQQGIFLPVLVEVYITMALTALAGLMLGLTLSAIAPNTDRAMSFVPLILIPQVIFSGILFKLDTPVLQTIGALFAMRWAMAGLGSSVGLHPDKLGVDNFAYQGTLYVSLNPDSAVFHATVHLLLIWGILVLMILVLGYTTAFFLKLKDVRR
jgi:ABC transport system ATP-binding/permease protein